MATHIIQTTEAQDVALQCIVDKHNAGLPAEEQLSAAAYFALRCGEVAESYRRQCDAEERLALMEKIQADPVTYQKVKELVEEEKM
jgi:hypothetical protein